MQKSAYLKITRPSDKCVQCDADLVEVRKHPSAVYDDNDDSLSRKDYCPKCWQEIEEKGFFSFWIAKREVSPERTRISRDERNKLLLAFFEHISRSDDGPAEVSREAYRFFLAHLLMRFRIFRWARTDNDSGMLHFENIQTGEEWEIEQIDLDDGTILSIKQEIEEYLRKGEDLELGF